MTTLRLLIYLAMIPTLSACLGGRDTKTIEVEKGEEATASSETQQSTDKDKVDDPDAGSDASDSGLVFPAGFTEADQKHGEEFINGWTGDRDEGDPQGNWSVRTVSTPSRSTSRSSRTQRNDLDTSRDSRDFQDRNQNSNEVVFVIQRGTGNGSWNSQNNPIRGRVGQSLVIRNEDDVPHLPHTNDEPFDHPDPSNPIPPGGERRYVLDMPYRGVLYDHLSGPAAEVVWDIQP